MLGTHTMFEKETQRNQVYLFCGVLCSQGINVEDILKECTCLWGEICLLTKPQPFAHTSYYNAEMGDAILRFFIGFQDSIAEEELIAIKQQAICLEAKYAGLSGRRVNLDPGYLTPAKVVLASTKDFSHRIYLGSGIHAEITLLFSGGAFKTLPWTYPDYAAGEGLNFLTRCRAELKERISKQNHERDHG